METPRGEELCFPTLIAPAPKMAVALDRRLGPSGEGGAGGFRGGAGRVARVPAGEWRETGWGFGLHPCHSRCGRPLHAGQSGGSRPRGPDRQDGLGPGACAPRAVLAGGRVEWRVRPEGGGGRCPGMSWTSFSRSRLFLRGYFTFVMVLYSFSQGK